MSPVADGPEDLDDFSIIYEDKNKYPTNDTVKMSKLTNRKNNDVSPRKEWGKNKIILDELLNSEQLEKVISGIVDLRVEQKVNE